MRFHIALINLILFNTCESLLSSPKQTYTVGGWITSSKEKMLAKWKPALETYLTQEVGPMYDPPINFQLVPFDYDGSMSPEKMIAAGKLDFAYTVGGGLTCLEAEYGYTTLATQVQVMLGKETTSYGSVILSSKSNPSIQGISDFKGKRIGVGHPWAAGAFQLAVEVVFYLYDYEAMITALLLGHIDVAVIQSAWLESNMPDVIPYIRYHGLINTTYQSVQYPFPTTTQVVPTYGIAAAPHIISELQHQVADALNRLNRTHPAAQAAGIVNFVLPASYEPLRVIVEKLGLLTNTPEGKVRVNIFEGLANFISCPAGYVLEEDGTLEHGCQKAHLTCPEGFECFCRPCHPDIIVTIYPWQVVLALCYCLFATGLCFSVGWICFLHNNHLVERCLQRAQSRLAAQVEVRTVSKNVRRSNSEGSKKVPSSGKAQGPAANSC